MLAIFKKEIRNIFMTSSIFNIFLIVFLFQFFHIGSDAARWFSAMKMALAVGIIGYGTGLISKEFKKQTYKLLFSSPNSVLSIILGKYFSLVVSFIFVSFVTTLICLIVRVCFGAIFTVSEVVFGFVGLIFLVMFFSAVVIFISTWSSNVGSLCAICYSGFFVLQLGDMYLTHAAVSNIYIKIYSIFFGYSKPYFKLLFGVISLETILYFASMVIGLLFLSKKFLESKRFV